MQDTQIVQHSAIREYEPLAKRTAWRIGGAARYYAEPRTIDDLRDVLAWARTHELPIFVLGGGSNLLVRDAGFAGLVVRYRAQSWRVAEADGDTTTLYVEAAAPVAGTVRRVSALGWGGLSWAEGLPGSIGGGVYGNAGCYGGDFASILRRAWLLIDGETEEWDAAKFAYGYRTSMLKRAAANELRQQGTIGPLVVAAELHVQRDDPAALNEVMARIAAERKGKTPWGSSCGSVFKNPAGTSAGRLIEQAGLKGSTSGAAVISERHANYIVNTGGASSDDVLRLVDLARSEVLRQFGVELELEVVVL